MSNKVRISLISLLLMVSIAFAFRSSDNKYFEIARNLDIFATLFKEVNAYYVDEVDPEQIIATGIHAMLASLDPYTAYIPEEQLEEYRTMTTGQYGGIGALVGKVNDKTVITMLYDGYGAERAGLAIGDEIVQVDDRPLNDQVDEDATQWLKGQPGTSVTVKVRRYGEEEVKSFTFDRELIRIANVPYSKLMENNVGYIRLSDFTVGAGKEVSEALKSLKQQGATGIVLDIRGNPGGLLSEAINVSNVFIPKGREIVSTKGKVEEWNQTYKTLNRTIDDTIPLAVLTNNMSASASEIVAGVIQDYDRGVLIGRRTFGKGLVQATRPLSYNSQLKLTTAKYYIPSGRCIQAIDYAVRNEDGSVSLIPDSLKVPFTTSNGRTVFDGGGLEPDVQTNATEWNEISVRLISSGNIFDYATEFYHKNPLLPNPQDFQLSDQQYDEFVSWLSRKGFNYKSSLERKMEEFIESAKEGQVSSAILDKAERIRSDVENAEKNALILYKDEIKRLITKEIVSRYLFVKGNIQVALRKDRDLHEAISVLSDGQKYTQLLGR